MQDGMGLSVVRTRRRVLIKVGEMMSGGVWTTCGYVCVRHDLAVLKVAKDRLCTRL